MKGLIIALLCYLAATSALAGGLLGGGFWLIGTETTGSAPARVAPIPQRIADSIERKKAVVPPQEPAASPPATRPMQEANAALRPPAKWTIRELTPPPAKKRNARVKNQPDGAFTPSYAVTTARNDNPY